MGGFFTSPVNWEASPTPSGTRGVRFAHVEKPFLQEKGIMQDMSPRRSPRFKKPSPKPELPKKPRKPERVNNPVENSVRQANYQVELAA